MIELLQVLNPVAQVLAVIGFFGCLALVLFFLLINSMR